MTFLKKNFQLRERIPLSARSDYSASFLPRFAKITSIRCQTHAARVIKKLYAVGASMWKTFLKQIYRLLYYLGKRPPSSAEVEAELDRLGGTPPHEAVPEAIAQRCDCLVTAGSRQVGCYPNKSVAACNLIGDSQPGLNGTPLPLGSCKNM
jgi:hypothetical protein